MGYDCVVCVKQVPDTKRITGQAMKEDGTVNRAALPAIFNPEDLNALETALAIRDRHGGTVTVVTMGPPKAADVLREACSAGPTGRSCSPTAARPPATRWPPATSCPAPSGKPRARLRVLRPAGDRRRHGPGRPADRREARHPQITYLEELLRPRAAATLRARRNIGNGWEVVAAKLPVLVTVTGDGQHAPPAGRQAGDEVQAGPLPQRGRAGRGRASSPRRPRTTGPPRWRGAA